MQKAAPSPLRIIVMVIFALSCFGLLLFLWVSFGGAVPLQPQGYRFEVPFTEASTLATEADVRIAGVNVGKVKSQELDKQGARLLATIELDERFAPIPEDTRALLRQKTLLGETYVELTPGDPSSGMLAEGGRLPAGNVAQATQLDEILRIFDPETRRAFGRMVEEQANSIEGPAAQALNDALGNLPEFTGSGSDVLAVLDRQGQAVKRLIRDTGVVFAAINEQEGALRELIVNSNNTFSATASQQEALAETIQIFPTFLEESRVTLRRLERFSRDTNPLVNDLKPVADDLGPTVRDLAALSPSLERLLRNDLPPLIRSSRTTLPEAERFLRGAEPLFVGLHQFLPELNPILSFANFYRGGLADFITVGGAALNVSTPPTSEPTQVYLLPQAALLGSNSDHFGRTAVEPTTRGNSYNRPGNLTRALEEGVIPDFSCFLRGGVRQQPSPAGAEDPQPPCVEQGPYGFGGSTDYPLVRGQIPPLVGGGRVPRPKPFPQPGQGLAPR